TLHTGTGPYGGGKGGGFSPDGKLLASAVAGGTGGVGEPAPGPPPRGPPPGGALRAFGGGVRVGVPRRVGDCGRGVRRAGGGGAGEGGGGTRSGAAGWAGGSRPPAS